MVQPLDIFLKSHLVCSDPHKSAVDVQRALRTRKVHLVHQLSPGLFQASPRSSNLCLVGRKQKSSSASAYLTLLSLRYPPPPPSRDLHGLAFRGGKRRAKANVFTLWVFIWAGLLWPVALMSPELVPSSVRGSQRGATLLDLNVVSVFIHPLNTRISEFKISVKRPTANSQVPQRSNRWQYKKKSFSTKDGNVSLTVHAEFTRCFFST